MFTTLIICLLAISCLLLGSLYEFSGAILLVIASATLIFFVKKKRATVIKAGIGLLFVLFISVCYLISSFYAVDSGMAFLGFIKHIWIIPALLCYGLLNDSEKESVFNLLPWLGSIMVVIGAIGYFIPFLHDFLYTNGRFGGFFIYANTQAIFLLLCIICMCDKKELKITDYIRYLILLAGIGLTGSRTVIVLTALAILYLLIRNRNIKLILLTVIIACAGIAIILLGSTSALSRITTLSVNESTFVGRILYDYDALPLLLKHPFGMGYLGYYYIQNSIQTGWYSVMYVHNDLLQFGLDLGLLPMLIYLGTICYSFFSKKLTVTNKVMILFLFLHGLFDFDLAFGSMFFVLMLILDDISIKDIKISSQYICITACAFIIIGGYFTIPLVAKHLHNDRLANSTYPWHTEAKLELLSASSDASEVEKLADEILKQNKTCSLAYYAKAMIADINGDYDKVIKYGKTAISYDYFNIDEYQNYTLLLYDGLISEVPGAYKKCEKEMYMMETYMKEAKEKISPLGLKIKDQPELTLTSDMIQILEALN